MLEDAVGDDDAMRSASPAKSDGIDMEEDGGLDLVDDFLV